MSESAPAKIGIVTVSDRASRGEYEDLGGPAIRDYLAGHHEEFHRIIVTASGNATLASLIQNLSGGTLRARLWRSVTEQDAVQTTKLRHRDIYCALRRGDAEQAAAADMIHLAEGEYWLRKLTEEEAALVRASSSGDPGPHEQELDDAGSVLHGRPDARRARA